MQLIRQREQQILHKFRWLFFNYFNLEVTIHVNAFVTFQCLSCSFQGAKDHLFLDQSFNEILWWYFTGHNPRVCDKVLSAFRASMALE